MREPKQRQNDRQQAEYEKDRNQPQNAGRDLPPGTQQKQVRQPDQLYIHIDRTEAENQVEENRKQLVEPLCQLIAVITQQKQIVISGQRIIIVAEDENHADETKCEAADNSGGDESPVCRRKQTPVPAGSELVIEDSLEKMAAAQQTGAPGRGGRLFRHLLPCLRFGLLPGSRRRRNIPHQRRRRRNRFRFRLEFNEDHILAEHNIFPAFRADDLRPHPVILDFELGGTARTMDFAGRRSGRSRNGLAAVRTLHALRTVFVIRLDPLPALRTMKTRACHQPDSLCKNDE